MQQRENPDEAELFPLESDVSRDMSMEAAPADPLDEFPSEHDVLPLHAAPKSPERLCEEARTTLPWAMQRAALVLLSASVVMILLGLSFRMPEHQGTRKAPQTATMPPATELVPRTSALDDPQTGVAIPTALIRSIDIRHRPAYSPAFSANGSSLLFHEGRIGATTLFKATLAGDSSPVRISPLLRDGSSNYHVQQSPDESRIAFDSDREGIRGVYVAGPTGDHPIRISGVGYGAVPRWSPDGARLVFVRAEPHRSKVWNLWTFDFRTGMLTRLTSHSVGQPWGGSWFPDSRRIAYSDEDRLVILDTMSGQQRVFKSPLPQHLIRTPAVSPDGDRIVFQVFRDGIWALDLRRGSMRRVLRDRTAEEFAWSPDGRVVAYHTRRNGEWGIWAIAGRAIS